MRLRDLDARFIRLVDGAPSTYRFVATLAEAQGLMFQCPVCAVGKERGTSVYCERCQCEIDEYTPTCDCDARGLPQLRVTLGHAKGAHAIISWLRNPQQLPRVPDDIDPKPGRWWAEGTSIDDLTFAHGDPHWPRSVQLNGGCNAHFCVTNGDCAP